MGSVRAARGICRPQSDVLSNRIDGQRRGQGAPDSVLRLHVLLEAGGSEVYGDAQQYGAGEQNPERIEAHREREVGDPG